MEGVWQSINNRGATGRWYLAWRARRIEEQRRVDGKENIGNSIRSGATSRATEYISSSPIGWQTEREIKLEKERNQEAVEVITRFI